MQDEDGKLHLFSSYRDAQPVAFKQVLADASATQSKNYADYANNKKFSELAKDVDYRVFINTMNRILYSHRITRQ